MKYVISMIFAAVLVASCGSLQPADQEFLLDQAVVRSLEIASKQGESSDRVVMWGQISTGLRAVASEDPEKEGVNIKEAVTSVIMSVTEGKDLSLADKRAVSYLAKRLVPDKTVDVGVIPDDVRQRINKAADTIDSAVGFWIEYSGK